MSLLGRLSSAWEGFKLGWGGVVQGSSLFSPMSTADRDRINRYLANLNSYKGFLSRPQSTVIGEAQTKRMRFNLCRPVVHMAAGWVASGLSFKVTHAQEKKAESLTQAATDIWDRSGGDAAFLIASVSTCIYGDMPVLVRLGADRKALLKFLDPCVCFPEFAEDDYEKLLKLTIKYQRADRTWFKESWGPGSVIRGEDEITYPGFDEVPAVWIPNMAIIGQSFGDSELDGVIELIEDYDHLNTKQNRVIDYYAKPTPYLKGVPKPSDGKELSSQLRTVLFLPKEGDCGFLEWKGNTPDLQAQLERTRQTISEVSETPAIAFGQVDKGFATASGVSLKVLYGPLEAKTSRRRAIWGPKLAYAMYLALKAEGHSDLRPEQVDPVWAESAPHNEAEAVEIVEAKIRAGISRSQALRELGYDEDEIKRIISERDSEEQAKMERQAKLVDRGYAADPAR